MTGLPDYLARRTLESLRLFAPVTFLVCLVYLLFDLSAPRALALDSRTQIAVGLLCLFLFSRACRPGHALPLSLLLSLIAVVSFETDALLGLEVHQDSLMMVVLMADGVVLLSRAAYLAVATLFIGAWLVVHPHTLAGSASPDEVLLMLGAAVTGYLCLLERRQLFSELLTRSRDLAAQRAFLERALAESQWVRQALDERVERQSQAVSEALELLDRATHERERLHDNLLQAHRIAAVGLLAGGLAHRINNQLTVVLGHLQHFRPSSQAERSLQEEVGEALAAATALAGRLLIVSGHHVYHLRPVRVAELLLEAGPLQSLLTGETRWAQQIHCPEACVEADPTGFGQVLQNLVSHANQANRGRGEVRLEVERRGEQVAFLVKDQGSPDEVGKEIFEPLGLPVVATIVQAHHGRLEMSRASDGGTCFEVLLPLSQPAALPPSQPSVSTGGETLLLVEDHEPVRRLAARFLSQRGYRVLACGSGPEALERLEHEAAAPDLVVSDIMMPGMDGPSLARKLKETLPGLSFLFVSGYADEALEQSGLDPDCYRFLAKPYTLDQLARQIDELLKSRLGGPASDARPRDRGTD